jgi:leucyl-tRNA synthetase
MRDVGEVDLPDGEPFLGLFTQGMVTHATFKAADGRWLQPAEVEIRGAAAIEKATGATVEVGPVEKMSKSKKNTVDPDAIIAAYGADTARWFVLSDSPPERDVEWTQAGVEGAARFMQRIWGLFEALSHPAGGPVAENDAGALEIRRAAHKATQAVDIAIEEFRFNSAIAAIHDWVNQLKKAEQLGPGVRDARLESASMLARCLTPFMPHLAEACWAKLGQEGLVSAAVWPEVEPALLVEDTVTLPIQVNGKRRSELTVSKAAVPTEVEAAALALPELKPHLEGKAVKKVIVVPGRIVNIVAV